MGALINKGLECFVYLRVIQRQLRESTRSEVGASSLRAIFLSILLTVLLGQTFAWGSGLLSFDSTERFNPPTTSPFVLEKTELKPLGPDSPAPALERLMSVVGRMQTKSYVPYVFGGNAIGSAKTCQACTECIKTNHLAANSTPGRLTQCAACRSCGVDCSNFVNLVFEEADMGYRFADTRTLRGVKDNSLESQFGFVNVGNDLSAARPGDVLLQSNHVMLLLSVDAANHTIDFIHSSRGSRRTPAGGIERVRAADMFKVGRHVEKILRHRELIQPDDPIVPLSQSLLKDLRSLIAWQQY